MAQALFAITKIYRMEKYSGERDDCNRALVIFFRKFFLSVPYVPSENLPDDQN
jgi:hypothetical protein